MNYDSKLNPDDQELLYLKDYLIEQLFSLIDQNQGVNIYEQQETMQEEMFQLDQMFEYVQKNHHNFDDVSKLV